jgi:hypothetical protein
MTRGYIGVVVTLDTFTKKAQEEIKDDKLPIILINGRKVSDLLLDYMNKTKKTLSQIVAEQDSWASQNIGTDRYDHILFNSLLFIFIATSFCREGYSLIYLYNELEL